MTGAYKGCVWSQLDRKAEAYSSSHAPRTLISTLRVVRQQALRTVIKPFTLVPTLRVVTQRPLRTAIKPLAFGLARFLRW